MSTAEAPTESDKKTRKSGPFHVAVQTGPMTFDIKSQPLTSTQECERWIKAQISAEKFEVPEGKTVAIIQIKRSNLSPRVRQRPVVDF